jgi:hypothetical protein
VPCGLALSPATNWFVGALLVTASSPLLIPGPLQPAFSALLVCLLPVSESCRFSSTTRSLPGTALPRLCQFASLRSARLRGLSAGFLGDLDPLLLAVRGSLSQPRSYLVPCLLDFARFRHSHLGSILAGTLSLLVPLQ